MKLKDRCPRLGREETRGKINLDELSGGMGVAMQ